ncbi:unnamed protein product, partial [Eretmochelys imbricata]
KWKRLPGRLGRSESLRVWPSGKRSLRGSAKGKQPRSRSDVDLEAAAPRQGAAGETPAGAGAPEAWRQHPGARGGAGGGEPPPSFLPPQSEETEPRVSELEPEPPTWRQRVPPNALLRLKKGEVKRQEVINELFLTEHAHVRMLRVLLELFYQPLLSEGFFLEAELTNIFPSLEEMTDETQAKFLENLKKLRDESDCIIAEIGDVLLARFDGYLRAAGSRSSRPGSAAGNPSRWSSSRPSSAKRHASASSSREAESQARCRRLQLKDIIPIEMQRLTKYPAAAGEHRQVHGRGEGAGKGAAGGRVLSTDPQPRQPGGAGNGKPHEAEGLSEAPGSLQPQAEHGPAAQRVQ